jgi:hypothetical protein
MDVCLSGGDDGDSCNSEEFGSGVAVEYLRERGVCNNSQWLSRFSLQAVKRMSVGRKMVAGRMGMMEVADMQVMAEK